jgi:hypothetical protein
MLKGNTIDLSVVERSQLPILQQWFNDVDFVGEFEPFDQDSLTGYEKWFDSMTGSHFFIHQLFQEQGLHRYRVQQRHRPHPGRDPPRQPGLTASLGEGRLHQGGPHPSFLL